MICYILLYGDILSCILFTEHHVTQFHKWQVDHSELPTRKHLKHLNIGHRRRAAAQPKRHDKIPHNTSNQPASPENIPANVNIHSSMKLQMF